MLILIALDQQRAQERAPHKPKRCSTTDAKPV